ncbi:MAG: MFS transporter [Candidatus Lokiarchaeota archaeon]|nr:MFS transporter [Candidatus Lokiarchaeota archaeon]
MISNNHEKAEKYIRGISINVLLMGFVSFFTDISSEMITAILPFFILSIAGGNILALGYISGISNAIANMVKGLSGFLSDKFKKRKPFIILGYSISNIAKPFIGLQRFWYGVLGLKITDRIGKGVRVAPRDALISYYSEKSVRDHKFNNSSRSGINFGIHRTMDTLGAVTGASLAALLIFIGLSYENTILLSIIPGVFAIVIIFFVKDVHLEEFTETDKKERIQKSEDITHPMIKLIIILSIMEFASVDIAFIMVRAGELIGTGGSLSIEWVILLYAITNIIYALMATPAGKLSDRFGKQRVISVGLSILFIISLLLIFPHTNSSFIIFIIFPLFGIYLAIVDTCSKAFISDLSGKNKKGKVYGLYYFLVGMLSIIESILFAFLYQKFSYQIAFGFSTALLLVCIIIFATADFQIKK